MKFKKYYKQINEEATQFTIAKRFFDPKYWDDETRGDLDKVKGGGIVYLLTNCPRKHRAKFAKKLEKKDWAKLNDTNWETLLREVPSLKKYKEGDNDA